MQPSLHAVGVRRVPRLPGRRPDTRPGPGLVGCRRCGCSIPVRRSRRVRCRWRSSGTAGRVKVRVTRVARVPTAGVGAVSLNVTVADPVAARFVTVFPCGERPLAANLNHVAEPAHLRTRHQRPRCPPPPTATRPTCRSLNPGPQEPAGISAPRIDEYDPRELRFGRRRPLARRIRSPAELRPENNGSLLPPFRPVPPL